MDAETVVISAITGRSSSLGAYQILLEHVEERGSRDGNDDGRRASDRLIDGVGETAARLLRFIFLGTAKVPSQVKRCR